MTMPKRSRIRRILKWAGVGISLVLLAAYSLSIGSVLESAFMPLDNTSCFIRLTRGTLQYNSFVLPGYSPSPSPTLNDLMLSAFLRNVYLPPRPFTWHGIRRSPIWIPKVSLKRFRLSGTPGRDLSIILPLWLPLLVAAVPTLFLLYQKRHQHLLGHCQKCGYNLTGNTSGICPECGKQIAAQQLKTPNGADRSDPDDILETIP